jgi:hypothetical protein
MIPKQYGEQLSNVGLEGIPAAYRDKLFTDFQGEDISFDIKAVNYGRGADWIWVLLSIAAGSYKVITEGDKIDKGLNGWKNIFKKIKKLIKKSRFIKLDSDVLLLIAASEVFRTGKGVKELYFVHKFEIDLANNSQLFIGKPANDFLSKDESYTLFIFKDDQDTYSIVGVTIAGSSEILKTIESAAFL